MDLKDKSKYRMELRVDARNFETDVLATVYAVRLSLAKKTQPVVLALRTIRRSRCWRAKSSPPRTKRGSPMKGGRRYVLRALILTQAEFEARDAEADKKMKIVYETKNSYMADIMQTVLLRCGLHTKLQTVGGKEPEEAACSSLFTCSATPPEPPTSATLPTSDADSTNTTAGK